MANGKPSAEMLGKGMAAKAGKTLATGPARRECIAMGKRWVNGQCVDKLTKNAKFE